MHPFPEQPYADRIAGDEAVAELRRFLMPRIDPALVDASRRLPDGFIDVLREAGYLNLLTPRDLGGRGLSPYNTFRVIEAAATWSVPVGSTMAVQAAIGAEAYLQAVPPGPLLDLLRRSVASRRVSGTADTEPMGAANQRRWTTATPIEDGAAYRLTGEKIHIGNGPIAELLAVTATVVEQDREVTRLFFVDTSTPGFRVKSRHEFMGLKGFPNAALTFDDVRVPRERVLIEPTQDRLTPSLGTALLRGRLYLIAAPSLAIARSCLAYSRDFVRRRSIDGRSLGGYEAIQRIVACSLADTFAIEAVADWNLLADQDRTVSVRIDQVAAKNMTSVTCWRVVERTMSLLAAEGFETAESKLRRGAPPLGLERLFRDARGLRISGGVDFQIDNWTAQFSVLGCHYQAPEVSGPDDVDPDALASICARLSGENRAHASFATDQAAALGRTCRELARRHARAALFEREWLLISLARLANEILTMCLVLARAARFDGDSAADAQALAHIYCRAARRRVATLWAYVTDSQEPEHARVSDRWLHDSPTFDFLLRDVLTPEPILAN
uniref:Acyl-CoA dehydrogenase n=1 Tax=uncultured bacterium AZ_379 TaxID=1630015 RepID=A0A0E3M1S2_9BACT|nr:acyl-CoA dehydrogenase [uncultured bacterium AZ_379]